MTDAAKIKKAKHEVVFYTYPKFVFTWPFILMGFLLWPIQTWAHACPEICAWIWIVTLIVILVTVGFDLNRNYTIFWLVLIGLVWILIVWLRDVKSVKLFSHIYNFFADLDPAYSPNLGLILSIVLLFFFLIMWVWTRINCKWRITHNEFERYEFGRMDDALARGAKRIRTSYPDFFELLVCLAGDLIIYDATGRRMLRRIQHVPLLPFVKRRINRIVEVTAVTTDEIEDEEGTEETSDEEDATTDNGLRD